MKFVTINWNNQIHIENDGLTIGFSSIAQCLLYTGVSLGVYSGKCVTYEPDRGILTIFDGITHTDLSAEGVTVPEFENLLANIQTYIDRKNDSYYGVNLARAIELKVADIIRKEDEMDTKPIPFTDGNHYKYTEAIINTIKRNEMRGFSDSAPLYENSGKWDNVDGSLSVPFTLGQLKALYCYGYDICADNFQNMKTHVAAVMQLGSVAAVKAYDYSAGWR